VVSPVFGDVRFGSADMAACPIDVRFTPKSGHQLSEFGCPLSAKSGHTEATRGHANNET
jgi:hypothetical protein